MVLSSRKEPELEKAVDDINSRHPGAAIGVRAHAGSEEDVARLVDKTMEAHGAIDILVANAGTNPQMGSVLDGDMAAWDKTFEVNVRGALLLVRAASKAWMYDHGGAIVTVASTAGLYPSRGLGVYGVSKAALIHLTKQLALELGDRNIRVNAVAPGIIQTRFAEALWKDEARQNQLRRMNPMGRIGQPSEVAGAVAFLVSDAASYINGTVLTIDGGSAFV